MNFSWYVKNLLFKKKYGYKKYTKVQNVAKKQVKHVILQ